MLNVHLEHDLDVVARGETAHTGGMRAEPLEHGIEILRARIGADKADRGDGGQRQLVKGVGLDEGVDESGERGMVKDVEVFDVDSVVPDAQLTQRLDEPAGTFDVRRIPLCRQPFGHGGVRVEVSERLLSTRHGGVLAGWRQSVGIGVLIVSA